MILDQHDFDIRFEWGPHGVAQLAPNSDAVVIVDVPTFSTTATMLRQDFATVPSRPHRVPDRDRHDRRASGIEPVPRYVDWRRCGSQATSFTTLHEEHSMYDLLIRNGRVVDGTGNPWFRADVGVKDGSIAAIGRIEGRAERVVDADGLYVAPGFIDVHCHADFMVLDPNNPRDFKLRQGITTECAGQCGESAAPVNPDTLDLLKAYVAFEAPVDGVLSWRWRTFDEYLRELKAFPIPTNFVPMVGHGTVRLEEAVRKMTSYAAQTMGLRRKGLLREGADADITVFDLDTVSASLDGNKCYPKGIEYVVVDGQAVVDAGRHDGAMAGRVVRRGGDGTRPWTSAA